LNSNSTHLQAE